MTHHVNAPVSVRYPGYDHDLMRYGTDITGMNEDELARFVFGICFTGRPSKFRFEQVGDLEWAWKSLFYDWHFVIENTRRARLWNVYKPTREVSMDRVIVFINGKVHFWMDKER